MRYSSVTGHRVVISRARVLAFAVLIGAGLVLAACGGENGAAEAKPAAPSAEPAPPEPAPDVAGGVPRISFAALTHDFGRLPDTESVQTSFTFTNTGTGTLLVSDIRANCGCTVPTLEKSQLLPGESTAIDVIFDPTGRAGDLKKRISVVSNAQPENVTMLTITAHVEATVRVEMPILNLGDLPLGQANRTYLNVYFRNPQIEIIDLVVDHPNVTARLVGTRTESPVNEQGEYRATVEVIVDDNAPWGVIDRANLTFSARSPTADADDTPVSYRVLVVGAIFGDLQLEPRYLASKTLLVQGQPFAITGVLSRVSGAPFAITDIRAEDVPVADAAARFEQISASEYRIVLQGTAPNKSGGVAGRVVLRTDVPGEENLVLLLSAYVKK